MSRLNPLPEYRLVYLATPYTKYHEGLTAAFIDAAKIAAFLIARGVSIYSPICHTHPIAVHGGINPLDHSLWLKFDSAMMSISDALLVGMLDGWDESFGVAHEIEEFCKARKPIYYFSPITMSLVPRN